MKEKIALMRRAIADGDLKTVKEMIKENKGFLNEMTARGSWLHLAAEKGQLEIAQYLIDEGIDVNRNGGINERGALCSAIATGNFEVVKLLIKNKAILDTSNAARNPLFCAIYNKKLDILEYLIGLGMDTSVVYKLSYGEVDALEYAKAYSSKEIIEYLSDVVKNASTSKADEKKARIYDKNRKPNLETSVLKELFAEEIKESIAEFFEKYGNESIFAMSYRMYYGDCEPEDRYQCEIIMQTKEGYQEQCEDEDDLLYFKYIPEEYKYSEQGKGTFLKTSDYLFRNCLNVEVCDELEDENEKEKMKEAIKEENYKIERIFADTIADLRKEDLFKDKKGREIYIFPYVSEDSDRQRLLSDAKIMNQGLDMDEYIEYFMKE